MFVLSQDVSATKRVIATLLATAIVLWASGAWGAAQAANITDVYDLISDSSPGASANHTIEFISPTGVANTETIVVTFPAAFGGIDDIVADDVDLLVGGVAEDIEGGDWTVTSDATSVTLTNVVGSIPAATTTQILIGTHATNEGSPVNQISNPTAPSGGNESYEIDISAGTSDSGHTRVVILDTVLVTATVDTIFEFTVTGLDDGVAVNGDTTTDAASSTTIPFGTLTANTPVVLAQDLQVVSNAINGFVVTVQSDGTLRSSTGAEIDDFVDGSSTNTPTAWAVPTNNVTQPNTWGHWGITTEDQDAEDDMRTADEFAAGEWVGASTTPREVFAHNGPADGFTPDVGSTTVGFKVEISPLQEAADDYATTLTYIATPTF